jgi:hypothetical protein
MGNRILHAATVAGLSAFVLLAAAAVSFGVLSLYVQTVADPATMQPGSIQYETREFWLSIDDIRKGRNQWTAELPDIFDADSR